METGGGIVVALQAAKLWQGRLCFDYPRWKENLRLPMDWARINQFPQWFSVEAGGNYMVVVNGAKKTYTGAELRQGIELSLAPGEVVTVKVFEN